MSKSKSNGGWWAGGGLAALIVLLKLGYPAYQEMMLEDATTGPTTFDKKNETPQTITGGGTPLTTAPTTMETKNEGEAGGGVTIRTPAIRIPVAKKPSTSSTGRSFPQQSQSIKVPASVANADGSYAIRTVVLTFNRSSDRTTPISFDRTDRKRTSLRLATFVAGAQRGDDMSGVTVALPDLDDDEGMIASLVIAIQSAMDGRELPQDCMVLGAVLSDGSLFTRGNFRNKLKSLAKEGMRRFIIPAIHPAEQDGAESKGDLNALAESLNLTVLTAADINDAYRQVYNLPISISPVIPADVLAVPPEYQEFLENKYRQLLKEADEMGKPASEPAPTFVQKNIRRVHRETSRSRGKSQCSQEMGSCCLIGGRSLGVRACHEAIRGDSQ